MGEDEKQNYGLVCMALCKLHTATHLSPKPWAGRYACAAWLLMDTDGVIWRSSRMALTINQKVM